MNLALLSRVESAYSSPPWWYDLRGYAILKSSYRGSLYSQIAFFQSNLRERHLEVAIGSGTLFAMVLRWHRWKGRPMPRIVGLDYSERMLSGARRRFRRRPEIELLHCDVADLPLADAAFTSVNIANALHCFSQPDAALASIVRVMAPGGTLAANVLLYPRGWLPLRWLADRVNRWGMRKGILHTPYEEEEVRRLLHRHGLQIEDEKVRGNAYFVRARKPQSAALIPRPASARPGSQ